VAATTENDLVELLAELEHDQWAHWAVHMLKNLDLLHITHWQRQAYMPYKELSAEEKEPERVWARKVLEVIRPAKMQDENSTKQQDWEAAAWSMLQPLEYQDRKNIRQEIKKLKQGGGETWAIGEVIERALIVLDCFELPKHNAELNTERGPLTDAEGKPLWGDVGKQPASDASDALELAKEALHTVEWCVVYQGKALQNGYCPVCGLSERIGHFPDCIIERALQALEEYPGKDRHGSATEDDYEATLRAVIQPLEVLNRDALTEKLTWLRACGGICREMADVIKRAMTVLESLEVAERKAKVTE